jgi:uncharacterized DUF497 family protein
MRFEFDPAKSAANHSKHGIDSVDAQSIWRDPDRLEIPARSTGERRWQMMGRHGDKIWSAFFTYRGDTIRIISVSGARRDEEAVYLET